MKKIFIGIICFFLMGQAQATTHFQVRALSGGVKKYIQRTYKVVPNKKLVLFEPSFLSASCPYIQVFVKEFTKQRKRTDLKSYSFQQQVLQVEATTEKEAESASKQMMKFVNECGPICIVSLQNNWIYSIKYPGVKEAATLSELFTTFKNRK